MNEKLMFDEATHTYYREDGSTLISVTQVMEKHGLSPNYDGVDDKILKARGERGTLIHKEIEDYIKKGEIGFTKECAEFVSYAREHNLKIVACEVIYHNDIMAGTCDLVIEEDGKYVFCEHKATSTLYKDSVAWQDTLYACLSGLPHKDCADYCYAFHYTDDGLKVVKIPLKPKEEAEKLIQAEREGRLYKAELEVSDTELAVIYEAEKIIKKAKEDTEKAKARRKQVYEAVIKAMREKGIKTYETPTMRITIKDEYVKTDIDGKRLKEEKPQIYKEYTKTTNVSESLVITLKGD